MERLEADASAVATSLEEEYVGRVASRSSSKTSVNSTFSLASAASSTQLVAYHSIDVETVSAVPGSQFYAKCQVYLRFHRNRRRMLNPMTYLLLVHLSVVLVMLQ